MTEDIDQIQTKINMGNNFPNPNIGKTRLTADDEYTFELIKKPIVKDTVNADNIKIKRAFCILKDIKNGNEVVVSFRIDQIRPDKENPIFQSPVITFFEKLGQPLPLDNPIVWSEFFIPTMKFRARVEPFIKDGIHQDKYRLVLATVRKYNVGV